MYPLCLYNIITMSVNQHVPLIFIETFVDDDDVTLSAIMKKNDYDNNDKYDQLSQISTGWNVVFQEELYDADDEDIKD